MQLGEVKRGQAKEGEQAHVHVLVSRTENLARYNERKRTGELERKNPYHLSPLTNHKNTQRGVVTGGFERKQYSERVEQAFDQVFAYERPLVETFRYAHTMQHGTPDECAALRVQAIREQQRQVVQPVAQQEQPKQAVAEQRAVSPGPTIPTTPQQAPTPVIEQDAPKQGRSRGLRR